MSEFKKGAQVKFVINTTAGTTRGKGKVKSLPPKGATRGAGRLKVVDAKDRVWSPFPSQCKAI